MSAKEGLSSSAEAETETWDYYGRLRQRAAEKPLQARMLSRVGKKLSADEKERWRSFGESKRNSLAATVDVLISEMESEPPIDAFKKLSIVKAVWSIMQAELDDASCALQLERIATKNATHESGARRARGGRKVDRKTAIIKANIDNYLIDHPDAGNSEIAREISDDVKSELKESKVPLVKQTNTLVKLVAKILKNDDSNGRRKFQRRGPQAGA
jgi:hypothetical protein